MGNTFDQDLEPKLGPASFGSSSNLSTDGSRQAKQKWPLASATVTSRVSGVFQFKFVHSSAQFKI